LAVAGRPGYPSRKVPVVCPQCGYANKDGALLCNLCQALFAKEKPGKRRMSGPIPPVSTGLVPDPIEAAGALAGDAHIKGFGVLLDFTPASIWGLDLFI